jgi:transposase
MELYVGLDLHSRNTYIGIMDNSFNRIFKKRVPNHLEQILQTLDPFRNQIKGFVGRGH